MAVTAGIAKTVMTRCDELARFSEVEGEITRTFLCEATKDVHVAVRGWMAAAGMTVRVDAAGNIVGRLPAKKPAAQVLLIGSHLDTVRNAGKYDGILGVLLGLGLVETLDGTSLPFHVDVVGFSEEEGVRFGVPFIGSKAVVGTLDERMLELTDAEGTSVRNAIHTFGLKPDEVAKAAYDPIRVLGYVEVHTEQGPRLAAEKAPVGVVSAIAGASRARVTFKGNAGHAGTSPMHLRRDALTGAAAFVLEVERLAQETQDLVGTVGQLEVKPGAGNVIPGEVTLSLDVRHSEDSVRHEAVEVLKEKAKSMAETRDLELEWQDLMDQAAVPMDNDLRQTLSEAAGEAVPVMPSGAGHDAMIMGGFTPSAMLFVRSPNGVSHHPDEQVLEEDVAAALGVLKGFVKSLAGKVDHA